MAKGQSVGVMVLNAYSGALRRRPLVTKSLTAAALAALSEFIAASLKGTTLSSRRVRLLALYGLLFSGPVPHFWHGALERALKPLRLSALPGVLLRVIIDQLSHGPFLNAAFVLFLSLCVEENGLRKTSLIELWRRVCGAQLKGWRVWPAAALVSYAAVPVSYRPVFMNLVALSWSTFLIATSTSSSATTATHATRTKTIQERNKTKRSTSRGAALRRRNKKDNDDQDDHAAAAAADDDDDDDDDAHDDTIQEVKQ